MSQLLRTFVKTQIQHDPQTREVKRLESLVEELQFNLKEANDQLHAAHTQIALLQGERRVVLPKV
ncbi:MAG: hypothetical protein KVP17_004597 [Porospora cf. gigantea B]|nr:MAG: hypothetical protein KVP17_004597 [Porospora cf. gigantea B]